MAKLTAKERKELIIKKVRKQAGLLFWRKLPYVDYPYGKSTYKKSPIDAVFEVLRRNKIKLPMSEVWKIALYIWHGDE